MLAHLPAVQYYASAHTISPVREIAYSYYPQGGAVFSVGSITYASGLLCDEAMSRITANALERLLR